MSSISYEIRDIVLKAREIAATGKKMHWLNIGDPNKFGFKPPSHVTCAIKDALNDPKYTGYCPADGDPQLRETIAKNERIDPKNVIITNGLCEGIHFLCTALLNPGDRLLLPSPCYPMYTTASKIVDAGAKLYKCDSNFFPDVKDLQKKIDKKTKAIVLISPNNPTGAVWPKKILSEILNIAAQNSLPVICDEIYDLLTFEQSHSPIYKYAKDVTIIRGNGLSKNYFYPGARVGYLSLHGENTDGLQKALVKLCNSRLSTNWEMQRGAIAAFSNPPSHIPKYKEELKTRRDVFVKRINQIEGLSMHVPQGAFYAFVKITSPKHKTDKDFVYDLMEKTGIVVVPGSSFSTLGKNQYFRAVFLPKIAEINEAMDKLEKYMKNQN